MKSTSPSSSSTGLPQIHRPFVHALTVAPTTKPWAPGPELPVSWLRRDDLPVRRERPATATVAVARPSRLESSSSGLLVHVVQAVVERREEGQRHLFARAGGGGLARIAEGSRLSGSARSQASSMARDFSASAIGPDDGGRVLALERRRHGVHRLRLQAQGRATAGSADKKILASASFAPILETAVDIRKVNAEVVCGGVGRLTERSSAARTTS